MKRDSFARERVTALPADAASVQLSWRVGRAEASTLQVVYIAFKMPVYPVRFIDARWREKKRERAWSLATCLGHSFTAFALYIVRRYAPGKTICNNQLNWTIHGYP